MKILMNAGAPVAQWVMWAPTDLSVSDSSPARGEISSSTVNGVSLHTTFDCHPSIVLIGLKYY